MRHLADYLLAAAVIFGLGLFMWHTSDLDLPLTYLYEKHK